MNCIKYDLGNAGEAIAAALLSIIFNGEAYKETMRGEGWTGLDLQVKYSAPLVEKTSRQFGVQVKTGHSYARWNRKDAHWVLQNLQAEHITKWQKNNQPVLIVWINPAQKVEAYWKFINGNSSKEVLKLSKTHQLRPEALFEIDRLLSIAYRKKGGVPKLTLRKFATLSETREWAKEEFKKLRGEIISDLGRFEISNYVFRHLTRAGKNKSKIKDSLTLLPYIKSFLLSTPHQIQTIRTNQQEAWEVEKDNLKVIRRKVLFVYRNVRFADLNSAVVYLRFKETIVYPKDWQTTLLLNKQMNRNLILESIYRKPE